MAEEKNTQGAPVYRMMSPSSTTISPSHKATASDDIDLDSLNGDSVHDRDVEITKLARRLTAASGQGAHAHQNPFDAEIDSHLDPNSENFIPRAWAEALIHLKSRDPEKFPNRTAGLSFRQLNVHGFGDLTDYQKSVGNIWLELGGLVRKLTGTAKPKKIEILHDFDGLVKSGEMLVVLGPPGSGCSTLLKTIAGEVHGIYVAKGSELNYQGKF